MRGHTRQSGAASTTEYRSYCRCTIRVSVSKAARFRVWHDNRRSRTNAGATDPRTSLAAGVHGRAQSVEVAHRGWLGLRAVAHPARTRRVSPDLSPSTWDSRLNEATVTL